MLKKKSSSTELSRRKFLEFLGLGTIGLSMTTSPLFASSKNEFIYQGILPSSKDDVVLAKGLKSRRSNDSCQLGTIHIIII